MFWCGLIEARLDVAEQGFDVAADVFDPAACVRQFAIFECELGFQFFCMGEGRAFEGFGLGAQFFHLRAQLISLGAGLCGLLAQKLDAAHSSIGDGTVAFDQLVDGFGGAHDGIHRVIKVTQLCIIVGQLGLALRLLNARRRDHFAQRIIQRLQVGQVMIAFVATSGGMGRGRGGHRRSSSSESVRVSMGAFLPERQSSR